MTRILTCIAAAAALSLASCASMTKKDSCDTCCAAPGAAKSCCTDAHAKGQKCATCEAPAKKK